MLLYVLLNRVFAASINWSPWVSLKVTSFLFGNFGKDVTVSNQLKSYTYTYCTASPYANVGLRAQAEIVMNSPYSSTMTLNDTACRCTNSAALTYTLMYEYTRVTGVSIVAGTCKYEAFNYYGQALALGHSTLICTGFDEMRSMLPGERLLPGLHGFNQGQTGQAGWAAYSPIGYSPCTNSENNELIRQAITSTDSMLVMSDVCLVKSSVAVATYYSLAQLIYQDYSNSGFFTNGLISPACVKAWTITAALTYAGASSRPFDSRNYVNTCSNSQNLVTNDPYTYTGLNTTYVFADLANYGPGKNFPAITTTQCTSNPTQTELTTALTAVGTSIKVFYLQMCVHIASTWYTHLYSKASAAGVTASTACLQDFVSSLATASFSLVKQMGCEVRAYDISYYTSYKIISSNFMNTGFYGQYQAPPTTANNICTSPNSSTKAATLSCANCKMYVSDYCYFTDSSVFVTAVTADNTDNYGVMTNSACQLRLITVLGTYFANVQPSLSCPSSAYTSLTSISSRQVFFSFNDSRIFNSSFIVISQCTSVTYATYLALVTAMYTSTRYKMTYGSVCSAVSSGHWSLAMSYDMTTYGSVSVVDTCFSTILSSVASQIYTKRSDLTCSALPNVDFTGIVTSTNIFQTALTTTSFASGLLVCSNSATATAQVSSYTLAISNLCNVSSVDTLYQMLYTVTSVGTSCGSEAIYKVAGATIGKTNLTCPTAVNTAKVLNMVENSLYFGSSSTYSGTLSTISACSGMENARNAALILFGSFTLSFASVNNYLNQAAWTAALQADYNLAGISTAKASTACVTSFIADMAQQIWIAFSTNSAQVDFSSFEGNTNILRNAIITVKAFSAATFSSCASSNEARTAISGGSFLASMLCNVSTTAALVVALQISVKSATACAREAATILATNTARRSNLACATSVTVAANKDDYILRTYGSSLYLGSSGTFGAAVSVPTSTCSSTEVAKLEGRNLVCVKCRLKYSDVCVPRDFAGWQAAVKRDFNLAGIDSAVTTACVTAYVAQLATLTYAFKSIFGCGGRESYQATVYNLQTEF
jgi:hypothetical protein